MLRALGLALAGLAVGSAVTYVAIIAENVRGAAAPDAVSPARPDALGPAGSAGIVARETAPVPDATPAAPSGSLNAQFDALARSYERGTEVAWAYVASRPRAVRSELVKELARLWTGTDVHAALTHADTIVEPALRTEWLAAVFVQWAYLDPSALLVHVAALEPQTLPAAVVALEMAAVVDAHAVLALAERLPPLAQRQVRAAAVAAVAAADPDAALRIAAERSTHGNERSELERRIAGAYASVDLDAALGWARALSPRSTAAMSEVAAVLAERDFDRAAALVIAETSAGRPLEAGTALRAIVGRVGNERIGVLADALAGIGNPAAASSLENLVWTWAYYDASAALSWAVERGDASLVRTAAIYAGDLGAVLALRERVPEAQRAVVVAAAAAGRAVVDLPQTLTALERLRGSPEYDDVAGPVLSHAITRNPVFAAQRLDAADARLAASHAPVAARAWAKREPREALAWALALADADVRATAVGGAVAEWAARNPRAAGDWAATLPAGPLRDHAIATAIVNAEANGLAYDRGLLARLSSADVRDRVMRAAATLPRLWRMQQALVANAVPGVADESGLYVGTLPWSPR